LRVNAFPHRYQVGASAQPESEVLLTSAGLATLPTQPPAEFGGPGDRWSPETLLVGAVVDCFVLSFRAVARSARLSWLELHCDAEGVLDRVEGVTRFTGFVLHARLRIPEGVDPDAAERALHRAEQVCLISNSLHGHKQLRALVEIVPAPAANIVPADAEGA
jgi:organic hydroperoxide reductase OsmC/OhrA